MPNTRKKPGYGKKDLRVVNDNPELTKADFAKARPFPEVFPDLRGQAQGFMNGADPDIGENR